MLMQLLCFFLDSGNVEESLPLNSEVGLKKKSPQICELHPREQQGNVAWDIDG